MEEPRTHNGADVRPGPPVESVDQSEGNSHIADSDLEDVAPDLAERIAAALRDSLQHLEKARVLIRAAPKLSSDATR